MYWRTVTGDSKRYIDKKTSRISLIMPARVRTRAEVLAMSITTAILRVNATKPLMSSTIMKSEDARRSHGSEEYSKYRQHGAMMIAHTGAM